MLAIVKGPNPLLRIGHDIIIIKVVITTQEKKSALPVKGHSHTCQSCINKEASASLRHTLTCSFERQVLELQLEKRERERERGTSLGEDILYLFDLSLGIVLAICIKEVLLGFLPLEGFPG
jgi:hypothetical protein